MEEGDKTAAESFFAEWWRGVPEHLAVPIFTLPDRKTVLCVGPGKAAAYAADRAGSQDVYFGVGLQDPKRKQGRGKAEDIQGLVALWADVDFGEEGHKKPHPPTLEEAVALVDGMPLPASVLVHSGHGLHAYWLFDAPLLFRNGAEDRVEGARMAAGWQGKLRAASEAKGWTLDATHDLARVLRVPGTWNRKGTPVPVRILRAGGPRHKVEVFRPFAAPLACDMGRSEPEDGEKVVGGCPEAEIEQGVALLPVSWNPVGDLSVLPKIDLACDADRKFRQVWEKKRMDLESASEYDMAIASILLGGGWSEKDVAEAILVWRTRHNENPDKARRGDYISRTLLKARRNCESRRAVKQLRDEMEKDEATQPQELPKDNGPLIQKLRTAIGIPIRRVIQHGSEGSIYSIELDDGKNLHLGTNSNVLRVWDFQTSIADYTHEPIMIRADDWRSGPGRAILQLAEMIENQDETRVEIAVEWVRGFLRSQTIHRGEHAKEAVESEQAFIRDDRVFFRGASVVKHVLQHDSARKMKPKDVYEALRVSGGRQKAEMGPQGGGRRPKCRTYWSFSRDLFEDVLVDELESEFKSKTR